MKEIIDSIVVAIFMLLGVPAWFFSLLFSIHASRRRILFIAAPLMSFASLGMALAITRSPPRTDLIYLFGSLQTSGAIMFGAWLIRTALRRRRAAQR